jgi:hypothetical protein
MKKTDLTADCMDIKQMIAVSGKAATSGSNSISCINC